MQELGSAEERRGGLITPGGIRGPLAARHAAHNDLGLSLCVAATCFGETVTGCPASSPRYSA